MKRHIRNILKQPQFTIINLIGLTIGIVSVLTISLWMRYELGYDGTHNNRERIYKISQGENFSTVPPLFNYIKETFPEIESIVRLTSDAEAYIDIDGNNNPVKINNVFYSDPGLSGIFTVNNITGNVESALNEPNSIILTKKTALRVFGSTDVAGRIVSYKSNFPLRELNLTIRSVIDDWPQNSTLDFDAIIPFSALEEIKPNGMKPDENWRDGYCNMFVLLKEGTDATELEHKLADFGSSMDKFVYDIDPESELAAERKLGLVSMSDLHFYNNNKQQLVIYVSIVGLLILILALINYVNLSVAKLFSSSRSAYIRKINGASRLQLVKTVLSDSVLFTLVAFLFSLLIIYLCRPAFNNLLGINLDLSPKNNPGFFVITTLMSLIIGIIIGLYPALKLTSGIHSGTSGPIYAKKERHYTRQSLVIFQFAVSIIMIVSLTVISKQLIYINKKDVGFDNEQILYTTLNKNLYSTYNSFRDELLKNPGIVSVAGSQNALGQVCVTLTREINGIDRYFQELPVDPDYIKTMGLELITGRNFSWEMNTDAYETVILNETAVKAFDLDNDEIIGTEIFMYDRNAKVIGVIKDFYFQSFHNQLDPFMLYYHPGSIGTVNIKMNTNNVAATVNYIKDVWKTFSPDIPIEYHFLDETYEELYHQDKLFSRIVFAFLSIAIIIACLGLFGLVSFTTLLRTKEIGIRKVNGAKVSEILAMLNKDFVKWVVIAFVIASPIAYYAMNKWLENFAYKTNMSWWIFALAGVLALGIALLTVSWQSWLAATRNPVEALRYE